MRFERLDRKVTLQFLTFGNDPISNEQVNTISSEIEIWAQKKALQGNEQFLAEGEKSRGMCFWYIRYYPGIDGQKCQLKDDNNQIWDIIGEPREIGRREGWELIAQRIAGQDGQL